MISVIIKIYQVSFTITYNEACFRSVSTKLSKIALNPVCFLETRGFSKARFFSRLHTFLNFYDNLFLLFTFLIFSFICKDITVNCAFCSFKAILFNYKCTQKHCGFQKSLSVQRNGKWTTDWEKENDKSFYWWGKKWAKIFFPWFFLFLLIQNGERVWEKMFEGKCCYNSPSLFWNNLDFTVTNSTQLLKI